MKQCVTTFPDDGIFMVKTALLKALGPEKIITSRIMRQMYAFDSSPFIHMPDLVVFPESTREVSAILRIARQYGVPVMARGAGTCLSGGAVPVKGGISLVMTRMNAILHIDPVSRTALVEPGVVNLDLQKALDIHGLIFPPDPASRKVSTIGGNVAECAGGIQGARYGVTKNYVLGLELVLCDGTIATTGLLSSAQTLGPDFTGIFNGSEGAFAVITRILVHLLPAPESSRTALASFAALDDAARAVSDIIQQGIVPTALELMDQTLLKAVDDFTGIGFPADAEALLLMEVDGWDVDLDHQLGLMVDICQRHHAASVEQATDVQAREKLWLARRSGNGALGRIRPAYMVHDVTVPRNQVAPLLTRIRDIGKTKGIIIAQMAHAGDGNAHPHLLYYPDEKNIQQRLHDATADIFKAALELGGTISGEHGIGLEKQSFMAMQFSRGDLGFMEKMKKAFDPHDILNPGKIFPHGTDRDLLPVLPLVPPHGKPLNEESFILEFIPENFTIKVRGETPLRVVQEMAATINARLPLCVDTQGDISMEELVGQGARGDQALITGSLREFIFGMEFTPPGGERVATGGHTAKNVAGFDFTRLLWRCRGELGKIDSITLRLMPCPENEVLMGRAFSSLKDCIRVAGKIIKTPLALCTLQVVGQQTVDPDGKKTGPWYLVAGLMGSQKLVAAHNPRLLELLGGGSNEVAVLNTEAASEFRQQEAAKRSDYPRVLLQGAGLRSGLFRVLAQTTQAFESLENIRVDIDFGCPELFVRARNHPASSSFNPMPFDVTLFEKISQDMALEGAGFCMEPPGTPPNDPVAQIIKKCLWAESLRPESPARDGREHMDAREVTWKV